MYNYKDLGLVNMVGLMKKAYDNNYAVPALNFISIEQFNGIIDAMLSKHSPVILLASPNLHRQLGSEILARISQSGVDRLKKAGLENCLALHLDHGMTYDDCVNAIDAGFSSVMIDGSALPFEENIALTKKVVEYAHKFDVSVEAELGSMAGTEEGYGGENSHDAAYTDPDMVQQFVSATGVDCLAISVGTCHGLVKIQPNPDGTLPELRYDLIARMQELLPGFPFVLHGSSTIMPKYVDMINSNGGNLKQATGIPEEQIAKAAKMGICKINIASDGWIAALALTRKILAENPAAIDSRVFTLKVRPELKALYEHKMDLMGSSGQI